MTTEQASAQAYRTDARNDKVLVYVNGAFVPRDKARVSVFDSGFALGDGVWEGLRLVKGRLISLDAHMDRLFEGARSIELDIGLSRQGVDQGRPGHARQERHDRRRAYPPDGDARPEEDAQPGSALRDRATPPS